MIRSADTRLIGHELRWIIQAAPPGQLGEATAPNAAKASLGPLHLLLSYLLFLGPDQPQHCPAWVGLHCRRGGNTCRDPNEPRVK